MSVSPAIFVLSATERLLCVPGTRAIDLEGVDADVEKAVASGAAEHASLEFSRRPLPGPFETVRSRLDLLQAVRTIHQRSRSFETKPHSPFKIARRIQYQHPLPESPDPGLYYFRRRPEFVCGVSKWPVLRKQG